MFYNLIRYDNKLSGKLVISAINFIPSCVSTTRLLILYHSSFGIREFSNVFSGAAGPGKIFEPRLEKLTDYVLEEWCFRHYSYRKYKIRQSAQAFKLSYE